MLEEGSPDVQKFSASLVIPDEANMSFRIDNVEYIDFQGIDLAPSKGNLNRLINPETIPYSKSDIYENDLFFPGKSGLLSDSINRLERAGIDAVSKTAFPFSLLIDFQKRKKAKQM